MRRAGGVEPGEAAPRVPVLRHRGAVRRRRRHRRDPGDRSRAHAARDAGRSTRLAGGEADRPVPELQGGHRCSIRRASGRTASSADRRRSSTTRRSRRRSGRRACCRSRSSESAGARAASAGGMRASGSRPNALKTRALVDRVHGVYIPYWTFDAQVALPVGRRGGPLLLHDRDVPGQQGQTADASGAARALGAGLRRRRSLLRRRAGAGHAGRRARRCCEQVEPFPTTRARAVRHRRSSRASSSSTTRWCCSTRRKRSQDADAREAAATVRRSRCPATPTATCGSTRRSPGRRSSTCSCPIWLLTYTYGRERFQVMVNGYTGAIAGQYPKSPWKILFLVLDRPRHPAAGAAHRSRRSPPWSSTTATPIATS